MPDTKILARNDYYMSWTTTPSVAELVTFVLTNGIALAGRLAFDQTPFLPEMPSF